MTPTELSTSRLRLRPWHDSDLAPFAALNADPRVMEYFPSTLTRAESDSFAARLRGSIAERGWGLWAVEVPEVTPFIGFVGLEVPGPQNPISPCVEIGWRIAAEHWGKGYASEAARAALEFGFANLELPEIVSFTATMNLRSRAVMERLGMLHTGETFEHPNVPVGHALRTHVVYRLTRPSD